MGRSDPAFQFAKIEYMKLLIVEDNAGIRRVLRRILAGTASTIWECADGSEALAAYEEHRPDIVLMDLRMTHVDGLTATGRFAATILQRALSS